MTEKQRRLAAYTRQILRRPGGGLESTLSLEAAIAFPELPGAQLEAALKGLSHALQDQPFGPGQTAALEAVVHKKFRPAIFIQESGFDTPPDPWAHLAVFRDALKPIIEAIGRVEVENASIPFGGTGFLVAPNLLLTNRHVAEIFTYGVGGPGRLRFIPGRSARLETAHEWRPSAGLKFKVLKPLLVHPHWDAAILQVKLLEAATEIPSPLPLCTTAPDSATLEERQVVVIGYPYWSDFHEPDVLQDVFRGQYGVKRLQPGKLMRYEGIVSFGHSVEALLHDASTLGGNSGSAVIDLETQQVLGLHFAGTYLTANYCVPMWELAHDPRVVDTGINFQPAPVAGEPRTSDDGGPIWLSAWKGRDEGPHAPTSAAPTPAVSQAPAPLPPGALPGPGPAPVVPAPAVPPPPLVPPVLLTPARPAPPVSTVLDPGWFERYTDEELRRMYQRNPEQFRDLVAATFPDGEALELNDLLLVEASVEGGREQTADPALPEIVLMPGILGSHLRGGFWGRSWLNPLTLPFSNLLQTLGLDSNGHDRHDLTPDGYLELSYRTAARAWRRAGFMVHEFSYDWRKPLAAGAQRLDSLLRTRRRARPAARFALVCHSMGGLVASIYARDIPDWRDFIDQAILCGSPLGGSFAIMEILTGEYAFLRKLDHLSLRTNLDELRQMGSTFPGALELLPHPALFSRPGADVELLYRRESYAPVARPSADRLQASRQIKDDLRSSPLLARATCLVSVGHPTAGTFAMEDGFVRHSDNLMPGDGTVPAVSALLPGVKAYTSTYVHSELLRDPAVIATVPDLLRGQPIVLPEVNRLAQEAPAPAPSTETLTVRSARWEVEGVVIRERLRHGQPTVEEVRWLLRPD